MKEGIRQLICQRSGKFTEELELAYSETAGRRLPKRLLPQKITPTVCGFCSTGCGLDIHIRDGRAVNLTPAIRYPVNPGGAACPKGWEALTPLKTADRAVRPYLRNAQGRLDSVSWPEALSAFVDNFVKIQQKYGQESTAFLSTGQITTEEMAFLGALAKFGMGFIHGDGNTRQCMATAVVAYKESFGFDAPPYTYQDLEESDVIIFVGANPCIAHPILWQRVVRNRHNPQIIVVDPRKTETAMAATRHYALNPKSDLALFYALAHILIKENWVDREFIDRHTQGFEDFRAHVRGYTPEAAARVSGLTPQELYEFAAVIHSGKRVSFWWTMGVNQSYEGVRTAQAIINLALMTGNMGRPGTGANSITGQCNAMGSRLFSNTTNLFGGHDFLNPDHRREIAAILEIDPQKIPTQNSLAYDQIIERIKTHKIKGLWVIATNPAHSWIDQNEWKDCIKNLEFLAVQDMYYTTDTAQAAHLILPAAGWGEKEGTFINSERRIGVIRRAVDPPGEALADFNIFKRIAKYWGCERMFAQWQSPQAVFEILKEVSRGQPCDISGIKDYAMIEDRGGIQWPFPEGAPSSSSHRRLFEDGRFYTPSGKAQFVFEEARPVPEPVSGRYPFVLLTGRGGSSQWHTQTRTAKSSVLEKMHSQHVYVEINPKDAQKQNIFSGQWVYVATRRGCVKAQALVTPAVRSGHIFMPMHYEETNQLTLASFDPYSRQPSYKICAASVSADDCHNR